MATFMMTGPREIKTSRRGHDYTIRWNEALGIWRVYVDNASRRAWKGLGSRDFASLDAVEAHYKGLRGVKALAEAEGWV